MTICQVSTVDGSPRLERQVQKLTIQMHHQCPTLTAAGYFTLGRNMILKVSLIHTNFQVTTFVPFHLTNSYSMFYISDCWYGSGLFILYGEI